MENKYSFDVPDSKINTAEAKASIDRAIKTALEASLKLSKMI